MVQRRNISYATQTTEGTLILGYFYVRVLPLRVSWESAFSSMCDLRISEAGKIPSLATTIREKSSLYPFGWSWQPE